MFVVAPGGDVLVVVTELNTGDLAAKLVSILDLSHPILNKLPHGDRNLSDLHCDIDEAFPVVPQLD